MVQNRRPQPWITANQKTLELWNFDVVEIFLQWRRNPLDFTAPYLECELSPDGNKLSLIIIRPRKRTATPWQWDYEFKHTKTDILWKAQLNIPIPRDLPIMKETTSYPLLYGGAFACLGPGDKREYYALRPNAEDRPDFHRPELFIPL
jgi:hypothetical protein